MSSPNVMSSDPPVLGHFSDKKTKQNTNVNLRVAIKEKSRNHCLGTVNVDYQQCI